VNTREYGEPGYPAERRSVGVLPPGAQHDELFGVFFCKDVRNQNDCRKVFMRNLFPSTLLSLALVSGLTGSALLAQDQAQPGAAVSSAPTSQGPTAQPHKVPNPQHQAKRMAKKLGLSSDQKAQIEPILADRDQQVQSLRGNTSLSPQDRKAQLRSVMQDSDRKIEAVLNDAQKQQYEQLKQEHRARRQQAQAATPSNS
jgi:Spy/CpxP family protein refolding chaperone